MPDGTPSRRLLIRSLLAGKVRAGDVPPETAAELLEDLGPLVGELAPLVGQLAVRTQTRAPDAPRGTGETVTQERLLTAREVAREAMRASVSGATLRRARTRLGVVVEKVGQPGEAGQHWCWRLPEGVHASPKVLIAPEGEHVRASDDDKPLYGADEAEGAHVRKDEHLRMSTFDAEEPPAARPDGLELDFFAPAKPVAPGCTDRDGVPPRGRAALAAHGWEPDGGQR